MKTIIIFLSLNVLILALISCNSVEPSDDNLLPGRRDYVWTVDTLNSPNNELRRIWASAENDAWVVGQGGATPYDGLWHFNGNNWAPHTVALQIEPECIYGFAIDNIWMAGGDGKIFHFNGSQWLQSFLYNKQNATGIHINDIWGNNPNDIYAIGRAFINQEPLPRSFILHYDGTNWTEIFFSERQLQFFKIQKEGNQLFLSGIVLTQTIEPDTLFFIKIEDNVYKEIYRNTPNKITFISLSQIGDKTYFLIGKDLCRYINDKFVQIISFNEDKFGYQVFGRSEKDIFISMKNGLAHYNGNNVNYLFTFSDDLTSPWPYPVNLANAVFFAAHDRLNDLNLILRGKLAE